MKLTRWIGIILIGIGVILRLYQLGAVPVALNRDEAALGYNAFTIATSGMDEWGERYPVMFKSFGDYKLPGYVYLTALFARFFTVSDLLVRLPSFIAGLGIIGLTYAFGRLLSLKKEQAMVMAGFVAIQPWAMFYSRMAFEANVGLCLTLLALYCLLSTKILWQLTGVIVFLVATFTYNAPFLLTPMFIILFWLYPSLTLRQRITASVGVALVGALMVFLLAPITLQKKAITIMSDPLVVDVQAKAYTASTTLLEKFWWYKETYWVRLMAERFINSLSPSFLTIKGGANPWHTVPGGAHLYWVTYILMWVSIGLGMSSKTIKLRWKLVVTLLVAGSLLPAVITMDAPHATRSLLFFWLVTCLSVWSFLRFKPWVTKLFVVGLVIEVGLWSWRYFYLFPQFRSPAWPVGLRESLQQTRGDAVALVGDGVDDPVDDQLYIYPLFYWRVPPEIYINTAIMLPLDNANMIRVSGFRGFRITSNPATDEQVIERMTDGYSKLK